MGLFLFHASLVFGITESEIGQMLFFDPQLSGNNKISCASCHQPSKAFTDGLAAGIGASGVPLKRKTPTLWDIKFSRLLFWDGRANSLEQQALGPIQNTDEMNQNLQELLTELNADPKYQQALEQLYPNLHGDELKWNEKRLGQFLAAYQRGLTHPKSQIEKFLNDEAEISESAKRGWQLFRSPKVNCNKCHRGPALADYEFWDIGLITQDLGRYSVQSDSEMNRFAFKTPTLWDVKNRAPFFHDGSAKTLLEVVEHYADGGRVRRDSLAPQLSPMNLSAQEKLDLVAFLESLSP